MDHPPLRALLAPIARTAALRAAALFLALAAACTGTALRDHGAMPTMAAHWQIGVAPQIEAKAAASAPAEAASLRAKSSAMLAALKAGDRWQIAVADWSLTLKPAALAGVDVRIGLGQLGPGGGDTAREAIRQFDERLAQLLTR